MKYTILFFALLLMSCKTEFREQPVQFVHISDTHMGLPNVSKKSLMKIVEVINKVQPPFVIHTGDVAHFYREKEWKESKDVFHHVKSKIYFVPGNHDMGKLPKAKDEGLWNQHMGAEKFSFVYKNIAFIGVNLTPFWQFDWKFPEQQKKRKEILAWLKQELMRYKRCNARFVFGHFPIFLTSKDDNDYKNSISEYESRNAIIEVLAKGKCNFYFCGHTHFGWNNTLYNEKTFSIQQNVATSAAYPALIKGWENHKNLREKGQKGLYLWSYYQKKNVLKYEFIPIGKQGKIVIFNE